MQKQNNFYKKTFSIKIYISLIIFMFICSSGLVFAQTAGTNFGVTQPIETDQEEFNEQTDEEIEIDAFDASTLQEKKSENCEEDFRYPDIDELTEEQLKSVKNFYIKGEDNLIIDFIEPVDLSDPEMKEKLSHICDYIKIGESYVEVDTVKLPIFNKKVRITFYNLDFYNDKIRIFRNKAKDTGHVSNIQYDFDQKILRFDIEGFSRYDVAPGLIVNQYDDVTSEEEVLITGQISDKRAQVYFEENGNENELSVSDEGKFEKLVSIDELENEFKIRTKNDFIEESELINIKKPVEEEESRLWLVIIIIIFTASLFGGGYWFYKEKKK